MTDLEKLLTTAWSGGVMLVTAAAGKVLSVWRAREKRHQDEMDRKDWELSELRRQHTQEMEQARKELAEANARHVQSLERGEALIRQMTEELHRLKTALSTRTGTMTRRSDR